MSTNLMLRTLAVVGLSLLMVTSCRRNKPVARTPQAPRQIVKPVSIGDTERGIASWYGEPYHGRRAANGEIYDMHEMTAAHRTMPFGTWVKVDNESNGKSTKVRITDRGPFVGDRIIDLSLKAAEELAMIGPGTARVKLTVIQPPKGEVTENYGVQILATDDRTRAEEVKKSIQGSFNDIRILKRDGDPILYRLIVGDGTREQAEELLIKLREKGYRGFVIRTVR